VPALQCDHNLFFIPEEAKGTIGVAFGVERQKELSEWQAKTGLDTHSIMAQPRFVNPQARDFRLTPDSPGRGAASDGGDIGRRQ
jgi:hypothetical protein